MSAVDHKASRKRLIVNADDFGRSPSINEAVIRAHREGILTTASLMVNEPACAAAVALARENTHLGVGLHLALVCGRTALPRERIPDLMKQPGCFSDNAVSAGMNYFFSRRTRTQLADEIDAQFEKFHATGLRLDHVNGHLNIHLHPSILDLLLERAEKWRIQHLRLTCDPLGLNVKLAEGSWLYRVSHWGIYRILSATARPQLQKRQIKHTERVFGLLQNARVDKEFVTGLLQQLPGGDSELYSHPSLDEFKHEFEALIDHQARQLVQEHNIELIRYQDL